MSPEDFPNHLRRVRKWYRSGYLAVNGAAVVLIGNIPGTFLWDQEAGEAVDGETFSVFLAAVALSILAFLAVQGSNPGYLFVQRDWVGDGGTEAEEETTCLTAEPVQHQSHTHDQEKGEEAGEARLLTSTITSRDHASKKPVEEGQPTEGNEKSSSINTASVVGGFEGSLTRPDFVRCRRCQDMEVPLRSHHCRACGRCVATFDHHCKVIGTCIGERNHCRFWWFLLAQTVSLAEAIRITMSGFSDDGDRYSFTLSPAVGEAGATTPTESTTAEGSWASRNALALACSCCLWPCFALSVVLLVTHSWMAISSLTSYECLRGGGRGPDSLEYLEVLGVDRGRCSPSPDKMLTPAGRDVVADKAHRGQHGQCWEQESSTCRLARGFWEICGGSVAVVMTFVYAGGGGEVPGAQEQLQPGGQGSGSFPAASIATPKTGGLTCGRTSTGLVANISLEVPAASCATPKTGILPCGRANAGLVAESSLFLDRRPTVVFDGTLGASLEATWTPSC
ncbi:unnamed protein product [Ectocarpus sp. CCAP 1310/34]|nr:unnamed protein product [Ectocarpus sp. CCAP 1310/34]